MQSASILDPFSPTAIDAHSQYLSFGSLFDVIEHQQPTPSSSLPQRTSSPAAASFSNGPFSPRRPSAATDAPADWKAYSLEDIRDSSSGAAKPVEAASLSPKPQKSQPSQAPPPILQRSSISGYHPEPSSAPKLTNKYSIDSIASTASGSSSSSSSHIITPRASLSSLASQTEEELTSSSALPGQSPSPTKTQVEKKTSMYSLTDVMFPHADGGKADVYGNIGSFDLHQQQQLVEPTLDYTTMMSNAGYQHYQQQVAQQDAMALRASIGSVEDFSWILDASATDNDSTPAVSPEHQQHQQQLQQLQTMQAVAPSSFELLPSAAIVDKASWQRSAEAVEVEEPLPLLTPLSSATQSHFPADVQTDWTSSVQTVAPMPMTAPMAMTEERPMTAPFHDGGNTTLSVPSATPHDMRKTKSSDGACHVRDLFAFHPQDLNNRRRASAFTTVPQTHLPVTPPRVKQAYQDHKQIVTQSLGARPIRRAESFDQSSVRYTPYGVDAVSASSAPMTRPTYGTALPYASYPFSTGYSLNQQYPTYTPASVLVPAPMPPYQQNLIAGYTSVPMHTSLSASVLQPAPTDLSSMPALSSEWVGSMAPKAPKAPRYTSQPPVLTSTPLTHGLSKLAVNTPKSVKPAPVSTIRPTTPSSSRVKSQNKSASTTPATPIKKSPVVKNRAKPKTSSPTQPFMGFINFTPADAAQIISAVAPSGSLKRKRERESSLSSDDASASPKRAKA